MWEYFTLKSAWTRKILADAAQEKQEEIQGHWQQESPFNEVLELERNADTDCKLCAVRTTQRSWAIVKASKRNAGQKESYVNGLLRGFVRLFTRLPCKVLAVMSIAQPFFFLKREHLLLEKDHRDDVGYGRRNLVLCLPALQLLSLFDDNIWWVSAGHGDGNKRKKKHCSQLGANANEAKVFTAHAASFGLCGNLINALKLLATQQTHGDSPIQSIVTGLHERSRRGITRTGQEDSSKQPITVLWTRVGCVATPNRLM